MPKNRAYADGPSLSSEKKWQTEADERRLTDAAEVVADRRRLKDALRCMREKQSAINRLTSLFPGGKRR